MMKALGATFCGNAVLLLGLNLNSLNSLNNNTFAVNMAKRDPEIRKIYEKLGRRIKKLAAFPPRYDSLNLPCRSVKTTRNQYPEISKEIPGNDDMEM